MQSKSKTHFCGIDDSFSNLDLGIKSVYVEVFLDQILEEMDKRSSLMLEKVPRNGFNLLEGLRMGEYPIILTSLSKSMISESKYTFSDALIKTGPVLIVKKGADLNSLKKLNKREGTSVALTEAPEYYGFLLKHPYIMSYEYASIPAALDDVVSGKRDGALVPNLVALSYIKNLYGDELEIVSKPLNEDGIRFASLRGENEDLLYDANRALKKLMDSSHFSRLRKEWNL